MSDETVDVPAPAGSPAAAHAWPGKPEAAAGLAMISAPAGVRTSAIKERGPRGPSEVPFGELGGSGVALPAGWQTTSRQRVTSTTGSPNWMGGYGTIAPERFGAAPPPPDVGGTAEMPPAAAGGCGLLGAVGPAVFETALAGGGAGWGCAPGVWAAAGSAGAVWVSDGAPGAAPAAGAPGVFVGAVAGEALVVVLVEDPVPVEPGVGAVGGAGAAGGGVLVGAVAGGGGVLDELVTGGCGVVEGLGAGAAPPGGGMSTAEPLPGELVGGAAYAGATAGCAGAEAEAFSVSTATRARKIAMATALSIRQ
jgi:hypothetical protein